MGLIPEDLIQKIIESNDIVDVISEFVPLKKTGKNYMGVCPFHGDKGPSLSVSQEKQLFHCFGCGASGNTVGFIMKIRNLEYIDAIRYLADRAGIKIVEEESNPKARELSILRNKVYEINIQAARYFYYNLSRNKTALEYFKNRGVTIETIKRFGLGYSGNNLIQYLKSKGFSEKLIFTAGLSLKEKNGNNNYYERFRRRVMFPVIDAKGKVIGFGGRVLDNSKPKYLNSPETPVFYKGTNLYGLNSVLKHGLPEYLIIVEGYMDCIALHQHGIYNAVASLGTSLTTEQSKLIRRYCKDVYICYDADAAGQTATLRGLGILAQSGCNVKVILIPRGKDPDEFLKENGSEDFKKLIYDSLPVIEYRIKKAKEGKNLKEIEGKNKFLNEVASILSGIDNEIEIQTYVSKVCDETGIDYNAVIDEINKIKKIGSKDQYKDENNRNNKSENVYKLEPAYKKAEKTLLKLTVKSYDVYVYINKKLKPEEFITDIYKKISSELYNCYKNNEKIDSNRILMQFKNADEINDAASIFNDDGDELNQNFKIIDDLIETIKNYNLEVEIRKISEQIKEYEKSNQIEKSLELSQKLIILKKQNKIL